MSDLCTYEYNVSIGTPPQTIWGYNIHYNISQTLKDFKDKLNRIFWNTASTWDYTCDNCVISFSTLIDNWNTILWKIIVYWFDENIIKVNKRLIDWFPWIEKWLSKWLLWKENIVETPIKDDNLDIGSTISTKA